MSEYLQRLRNGAAQGVGNLQELVTSLKQRCERFYNEPAHHRSKAAIDFVKDYWDLGAAVAAGIVFADADKQIFGYNSEVIAGAAAVASALGSISRDSRLIPIRLLRNLSGAFGGWSAESGVSNLEKAGYIGKSNYPVSYFTSTFFFGTPTAIFELFRIGLKQEKFRQQQNQTLEILAQQNNINHSATAST